MATQDLGAPGRPQTVEQALNSALGHLRDMFDDSRTDEDRVYARTQYESEKRLIVNWMGDMRLGGVGRQAIEKLQYAENRMWREKAIARDGEAAVNATASRVFPAADAFKRRRLEWERSSPDVLAGGAGTTQQYMPPVPTDAEREELLNSGDPEAVRLLGIGSLVKDGQIVGGVTRAGFFDYPDNIQIDSELADMPSGWGDPETVRHRENVMRVLYSRLGTREDGSRFATLLGKDGLPMDVTIPDLSNQNEIDVTDSTGETHKIKVTEDLLREIQRSRSGGMFDQSVAQGVRRLFDDNSVETYYGQKILVPNITGNSLMNEELSRDPVWQRAIMDSPEVPDFWWNFGRQLYGTGEFMGVMLATEGAGAAIGAGGRAIAGGALGARAASGVAKLARGVEAATPEILKFGSTQAGSMAKAAVGGPRASTATRLPGTYYDVRQIGEEIWYNAVVGAVNGQWDPGSWIVQGWNEGVSEYALGSFARFSRHAVGKALESGLLRDRPLGRWYREPYERLSEAGIDPSSRLSVDDLEFMRRGLAGVSAEAASRGLADAVRRGLVDEFKVPMARELLSSLYDSAIVGLGFGMYQSAHKIASGEGRTQISAMDMLKSLAYSDTWGTVAGTLFGHGLGVAGRGFGNRENPEAVKFAGGLFGLELNPDQKKFVNDIAQHAAFVAEKAMSDPKHAEVVKEWFDRELETNLDFHAAFNEMAASIDPSLATPEPISGNGINEHVESWREDRESFIRALRYEENAGLERMFTRLDSGRPGSYPGDWNATIRDIKDAVLDQLQRNYDGEPHGQALTGQNMNDRERRAMEKWRDVERRYETERKAHFEQMRNVRSKLAGMVKHVYAREMATKKHRLLAVREAKRAEKARAREAIRTKKLERIKKALNAAAEKAKRKQDREEAKRQRDEVKALKREQQAIRQQEYAEKRRLRRQQINDRLAVKRAERLARIAEENARRLGLGQKILEGMPDVWHGGYALLEWNPKYMSRGAGDQWQGWGFYTGEERKVGEYYKRILSERFESEAKAESGIVDVTVGGQSAAVLYQGELTSAPNTDNTISLDELIEPLIEDAIDRSGQEVTDSQKGGVRAQVLYALETAANNLNSGASPGVPFSDLLNKVIEGLSSDLETISEAGEDSGLIGPAISVLQSLIERGLDAAVQPPTKRPTPTINRGKLLAPKDRFLRFYERFGENTEFVKNAILRSIADLADAGLLRPRMQIDGLKIDVNIKGKPVVGLRQWLDAGGVAKELAAFVESNIAYVAAGARVSGLTGYDLANAERHLARLAGERMSRRGDAVVQQMNEDLFDFLLTIAHSSIDPAGTFSEGSIRRMRQMLLEYSVTSHKDATTATAKFLRAYADGVRGKVLKKYASEAADATLRDSVLTKVSELVASGGITFKSDGARRVGWSFGHEVSFGDQTWIEVALVTPKGIKFSDADTGQDIYKAVAQALDENWDPRVTGSVSSERASKFLLEHGIRGTVYADALTKNKPESEQTMNRVLFDLKDFVAVEHNDAPITSAQMQVAAERIVNALDTHPAFAHLGGDNAAIVQAALEYFGGNPNSFSDLAAIAVEAEAMKRERAPGRPIKLGGREKSVERSTPASRGDLIRELWEKSNQSYFNVGRDVLSPSAEHGSDYGPLSRASAMGAVAALQAQFGVSPELRALARSHQISLAAGIIIGSGMKQRAYSLAAAVSGLTPGDMALIEQRLEQIVPAADELAQNAIDFWTEKVGFEIMSKRARDNASTKKVLRLIALGASGDPGVSTSDVLGGDLRSHAGRYGAITKISKVVMETVGSEAGKGTIASTEDSIENIAQKMATAQLAAIEDAIRGLPKSGLRGEGLWLLLKKRIAYHTNGDQWSDTEIGNSGYTPRMIADGIVEYLGSNASKRLQQQPIGGGAKVVSATAPEALSSETRKEENEIEVLNRIGEELVSALAEIRKVTTKGNLDVRGMVDTDEKPLVDRRAPESEVRRVEAWIFRLIADGDQRGIDILEINGFDSEQIESIRSLLNSAQARIQRNLLEHVKIFGFSSSSNKAEDAKTVFYLFQAIKNAARGIHEIDGEAKKLLSNGGWLNDDGTLKENAAFRLSKLMWQSLFDATRHVFDQMRNEGEYEGSLELDDLGTISKKVGGEDIDHITMVYSMGLSWENLRLAYVVGGDFIFGYYEEYIDDYPWKGKFEPVSPDSLSNWLFGPKPRGKMIDIPYRPAPVPVSLSALLDRIGRSYPKAGPIQKTVVKWSLSALQNTVSGKSRGVMTSEVRKRMKAQARADAGGRVEMHQILAIAESTLRRVDALNLSTRELELIGKAVSHGLARDVQSQERWNRVFGERYAHLWPVIQEINRIFEMMAQKYVDVGIMTPERARNLVNAYFKNTWIRIAYDESGRVKRATPLGGGRIHQETGDFEHSRQEELDREDMRRIFDIRYVMPTSLAEAANRLRLFRTIKLMIDNGVHWTREEYDNAPDIERFQARRAAVQSNQGEFDIGKFNEQYSRLHSVTGIQTPEVIEAENELRRAELNREIRDQREGSIYSAMVYELIQRERASHGGEGQPEMTEEMERLLSTLETCYLPVNALKELGYLIDQTEVGGSINQSQFVDFVSKMSLEWRRTHTIFTPRHWGVAHISNFLNNHIGGKVPMHDVLDPMGFYSRSARGLLKYQKLLASGFENVVNSRDPEIKLVGWFMLRAGGSTFASSLGVATNGNDWLAAWMDRVSSSMSGMAGRSMSETTQAAFADRIALAQTSLTRASVLLNTLSTANSPEARAEIIRELIDTYGYVDMLYKYAAFLRGMRLGMTREEAYDWATEATGDFNDLNPTIRSMTSTFGIMRGSVYTVARQRVGKGARVGTSAPGAGRMKRMAAWTEHFRNLGVGGPFWGYNFLILPFVGRSLTSHPWKAFTGVAAFAGMAMGVNAMAGGDDEDRLLHAGDPEFMHLRFDEASFDAYSRTYGKQPMWGNGPWKIAVADWFRFMKAAALLQPEGQFLFRSRGPRVGGRDTEIDWTKYMPGVSQVTGAMGVAGELADAVTGTAGPQGSGHGLSETGMFAMPIMLASFILGGIEMAQGVQGETHRRTIGENAAKFFSAFSAPMGGLFPWWMSREGLFAAQNFAWGNRTIGEHIDAMPPDMGIDPLESIFGVAAKTMLPLRARPSRSKVTGDDDTRVQGLLGLRYRQPKTGSDPEKLAATHGALSREAILDGLAWAYRNAREYGSPPQLWFSEAMGLEADIQRKEEGGTVYYDVVDQPKTRLGQFIRNAEADPKDRRSLARKVYMDLAERRDDLNRLASDPEGLIYRTAIPPELFERMARGVWDKGTNAPEMVKLIWREATDARLRGESQGKYDATLARIWNQWGLDKVAKGGGQSSYRMWEDMQEFLKGTAASYPDQNQAKVQPQEVKEIFGAKAWDLFPSVMNKRPEYSFMRGN